MSNWNWKVVRQFLKQSFDLGLSRSSCLNYLHRLGFVLKRPKKRLLKAKDEARKAFVLQYRQIREEAQESGAKIFFVDEAHFRASTPRVVLYPTLQALDGLARHTPLCGDSTGRETVAQPVKDHQPVPSATVARGWWLGAEVHAIFPILPLFAVFYEPVVGTVLGLRWVILDTSLSIL